MAQDPWEAAAAAYNGSPDTVHTGTSAGAPGNYFAQGSRPGLPAPGTGMNRYGEIDTGTALQPGPQSNDDYKLWDRKEAPQERLSTQIAKEAIPAIGQLGIGALKGLGSDALSSTRFAPYVQPKNQLQSLGRGTEQAGEFLIPGLGEEAAASKFAEHLPQLGKAAEPIARIGYNALTSGAINKAQGGGFGTGAIAGGVGSMAGQGLKSLAPGAAETAMGVRGTDRAFSADPGTAILNETTGLTPRAVAQSAKQRVGEIADQQRSVVRAAGVRPQAPVRGLLQSPEYEIPLNRPGFQWPRGGKGGGLFDASVRQDFAEGPDLYPEAGKAPGAMEERGVPINGNERYSNGIPNPQYLPGGPHPELSGRVITPKGVLRTRDAATAAAAGVPFEPSAPLIPHNPVSLAPSRNAITRMMQQEANKNATSNIERIDPLLSQITTQGEPRGGYRPGVTPPRPPGAPIPQLVSPEEALDLRQGIGNFQGEKPWTGKASADPLTHAVKHSYSALSGELHSAVPQIVPLDRRLHNLLPVADRAAAKDLNAPFLQRLSGRVGAHTGALTGAAIGGMGGYQHGGMPDALKWGGIGLIAPEVLASPTVQMGIARGLYSRALSKGAIPLAKGIGLQANRKSKDDANQ